MKRTADDPPRRRIEAEAAQVGQPAFARVCADVLGGAEPDPRLVRVLAGGASGWFLDAPEENAYWARVWAARGLLWAWDDVATAAIVRAFDDDAWRVREMALKVVARHRIGDALTAAAELRGDPVPRVRAAATRAVTVLTATSA